MLWILPINLPVLVVWIRNLAVHWLTPFSSHHNIVSIVPLILLIETLSIGRMVPRIQNRFVNTFSLSSVIEALIILPYRLRYITHLSLLCLGVFAAVRGVSYAYQLHHVVNIFCFWLVALHWSTSSFSFYRLNRLLDESADVTDSHQHIKKRP
jgi:glycosylphosphatidylinositol deacylase